MNDARGRGLALLHLLLFLGGQIGLFAFGRFVSGLLHRG